MKKIVAIALTLLSLSTLALEVQCDTSEAGIDFVLKKSPETQITYALMIAGSNVYPVTLPDENITSEEEYFMYSTKDHLISIDYVEGVGLILMDGFKAIELSNCQQF